MTNTFEGGGKMQRDFPNFSLLQILTKCYLIGSEGQPISMQSAFRLVPWCQHPPINTGLQLEGTVGHAKFRVYLVQPISAQYLDRRRDQPISMQCCFTFFRVNFITFSIFCNTEKLGKSHCFLPPPKVRFV